MDTTTYNKALKKPIGAGYDFRPKSLEPDKIIVHSTNGNRGSTLRGEAEYLFNSTAVSAHYLVGKKGEQILIVPDKLRAWHAGTTIPGWENSRTLGIECHHAEGEAWTSAQKSSLTALVQGLMARWNIHDVAMVDTHRKVATPGPNIRKHDPSDWNDEDFYAWRATLVPIDDTNLAQVDPRFVTAYLASGGVWIANRLTPGLVKTPSFAWQGKLRQLFERSGATLEENGSVSWMFPDEYLAAREFYRVTGGNA